ncbi:MAG TPA: hypothetical protein VNQ90_09955 [Chthoniobacteraceae bacterium]|nr:hypothetical protein [Chthoniobacteraceae bacterium]
MKRTYLLSSLSALALATLLLPSALQADPTRSPLPPTQVVVSETDAGWTLNKQAGSFHLQNGRTETDLALRLLKTEKEGETTIYRYQLEGMADAGATVRVRQMPAGYLEWELTVDNRGKEALWLEPRLELALPAGEFEWYDGFETRKKAHQRDENVGTLPFAAFYASGKGSAIGIDPTELVSHFRSRVSTGDHGNRLEYASRMVIDPGASETRRFIAFGFEPDFGYLNAVADYQRFFPAVFHRAPGVHPNLSGPISGPLWRTQNEIYPGVKDSGHFPQILEALRWTGGGWDWCYAGFGYRPGDWLCTEELTGNWMVAPDKAKPEAKIPLREYFKKSATEYLQQHLDAYQRLSAMREAPLMYIIPNYCEEELAKERFADSIYYDAQGKQRTSGPPWVVKFDRSVQMYAHGNSFGDYTQEAIRKIAERSEIRGFGFDCIDRARYLYTGPGTERSPGRAYDKELGVYVNMETAHAIFGRKVHELKRDGHTLSLAGNFRGSSGGYLAASAMDATLLEHSPWDERPMPGVVRLLMGKKSMTYLHGYAKLPELDKLDKDRLVSMLSTLADFTVLQSLRYAIYPSMNSVIGSPKLIHYSGIFNDLFRHYGWEPVPAVRGHEKLWLSRYGSGAGGVLFAGNATPREITQPLEVTPSYFEAGAVAFVDYEGGHAVHNDLKEGRTHVPATLSRGDALLLAAAVQWEAPFEGSVEGRRERTLGESVRDTLEIIPAAGGKQALFTTELPGYTLESVSLEGKPLNLSREEGKIRFEAALAKGKNNLTIVHRPNIGNAATELVAKTEFLDKEGRPAFSIILPREEPALRRQVDRIRAFFSKLDIKQPLVEVKTTLKDQPKPEGALLFLGTRQDLEGTPFAGTAARFAEGEIVGQDGAIGVISNDAEALEGAVTLLLDTLQRRYPSYGYLAISGKSLQFYATSFRPDIFQKKTGLEFLPWEKTK